MKRIDLNCDVGEGVGNEAELMPYLSSCNISCGLHAGDDNTIREVILLAKVHGVAIGAHPSFDDRTNFGRKEMRLSHTELKNLVREQVKKMLSFCKEYGVEMSHVKPHGALYNQAAKSLEVSKTIIETILEIDDSLKIFGLANSETEKAAKGKIRFVAEGFVDRKYQSNKELMSRVDGGLITDQKEMVEQLKMMLSSRQVQTPRGLVDLHVESLCLHGDTPGAAETIKANHKAVLDLGYQILPPT